MSAAKSSLLAASLLLASAASAAVVAEVEANNTFSTAQVIGLGSFDTVANADIFNSTLDPHATIAGTGNGTFDYYRFTLGAGQNTVVLDIDNNNFDTEIGLWNAAGTLLTTNDDSVPPGDGGIQTGLASFLAFGNLTPGADYIIGVGRFNSVFTNIVADNGISGNAPLGGGVYNLHISQSDLTPAQVDLGAIAHFDRDLNALIPVPFTASITAANQNTAFALYDSVGNRLAHDNGSSPGNLAALSVLAGLPVGQYFLVLGGPGTFIDTGAFAGLFAISPGPFVFGSSTNYTLAFPGGTFSGSLPNGALQWFSFNVDVIPEPSTMVVFGALLGCGCIILVRRRKNEGAVA